jgi:hypothetical protein
MGEWETSYDPLDFIAAHEHLICAAYSKDNDIFDKLAPMYFKFLSGLCWYKRFPHALRSRSFAPIKADLYNLTNFHDGLMKMFAV